jgi:hypothetical protein
MVHRVTADFCQATLATFPYSESHPRRYTPLSATELRRLHRALYRFQLCCMLSNEGPPDSKSSWEFDDVEKSHKFLSIFPAWRVEEIGCIYDYMISKYTSLFKDIEADLSKTSPRFADEVQREPVTPCGCYDVSPEGTKHRVFGVRKAVLTSLKASTPTTTRSNWCSLDYRFCTDFFAFRVMNSEAML